MTQLVIEVADVVTGLELVVTDATTTWVPSLESP
jgi:hypothetical protein